MISICIHPLRLSIHVFKEAALKLLVYHIVRGGRLGRQWQIKYMSLAHFLLKAILFTHSVCFTPFFPQV